MLPENVFDAEALIRICQMREGSFAKVYGMTTVEVAQPAPANYYHFKDNGSDILAVAHLDTVAGRKARTARIVDTEAGPVVHSRALDDRLGAYVILDMLPKLGLTFDWLLTTGEESGLSTAAFFDPPKKYRWIIEFDRGGTDVVMYHYEDPECVHRVRACGAKVGRGSFSDISYLDHLGVKAFNWGVGYRDYHGPRAHAYLEDTFEMVDKFLTFHAAFGDVTMPHDGEPSMRELAWGWPSLDDDWEEFPSQSSDSKWDKWNEWDDDEPDFVEYPSAGQVTKYLADVERWDRRNR